jgi:hypothetical protein
MRSFPLIGGEPVQRQLAASGVACRAKLGRGKGARGLELLAHCDGLDGPVVKAAQKALETRDPALVLIWVQAEDVAAGREYVKAYVEFIHYVERLYEASTTGAHGHVDETEPAAHSR